MGMGPKAPEDAMGDCVVSHMSSLMTRGECRAHSAKFLYIGNSLNPSFGPFHKFVVP